MHNKWIRLISLLMLFFSFSAFAADKAILLKIDGPIGPATQDYIERGIETAKQSQAAAIIIQLNTPGGLETAMRGINEAIITSKIPVITYVAPSGARAASAGLFILYASNIAAMAPGTNVGAATPINLTDRSATPKEKMSASEQKAMNDSAAYIRSLAQLRGRNVEWGEKAVTQAASLSAEEAKQLNVINLIADNQQDLLTKIDGKPIPGLAGGENKLSKNLEIQSVEADWRHQFLSFLTNPNIAYILMLIAIYGLFFELATPGAILPGVVGTIALILTLYAFQLLPINYAGLTLLLVGVAFMVFEVYISSYGVIGIGGVIAFMIGSVMLFDIQDPHYNINMSIILSMAIISVAFFFMVLTIAFRSHKRAIVTGKEGLIGSKGVVLSKENNNLVVRVLGEMWDAKSVYPLFEGDKIRVVDVHGLVLSVEPIDEHEHKPGDK